MMFLLSLTFCAAECATRYVGKPVTEYECLAAAYQLKHRIESDKTISGLNWAVECVATKTKFINQEIII